MNEQAAILLRYLHILAADLIGPAGGPYNNNGFEISPLTPVPNPLDFQIGFGNYYVNGLLCQADYIPIAFFPTTTTNVYQVMNWSSDFELKTVPYFEVFDATPASQNSPVPVQITNPKKAQSQITIQPTQAAITFSSFPNPKLRRVITYLHQPDFVFSAMAGASVLHRSLTGSARFLSDVWEHAMTYAEDDSIAKSRWAALTRQPAASWYGR